MDTNREIWMATKQAVYQKIADLIMVNALYELNSEPTWTRLRAIVEMGIAENTSCLAEWKVLRDSAVNTPETIEANEFHLKFCWKVELDDEWTVVEFALTSNGLEVKQLIA
jgi:hypothetical protein